MLRRNRSVGSGLRHEAEEKGIALPARLAGSLPGRPVTVVGAQFHGAHAVSVPYEEDNGHLGRIVLYRQDENQPHLEAGRPFDADPREFKIAAEAQRTLLAGAHDPMLAVATSDV